MEEITKLSHAKCPNDEIGRAFLFSCVTGIRYCDVKDHKLGYIKDEICSSKDVIISGLWRVSNFFVIVILLFYLS